MDDGWKEQRCVTNVQKLEREEKGLLCEREGRNTQYSQIWERMRLKSITCNKSSKNKKPYFFLKYIIMHDYLTH